MSKTQRNATAGALFLIAATVAFVLTKRRPPAAAHDDKAPLSAAPIPGDPGTGMQPGEVRPGPDPGTLIVQPFQPDPPKTISADYRVPTHRDDARITRNSDGSVVFEQAIELAHQLHSAENQPLDDLQILDAILGFYRLVYRSNPVGENLEVLAALTGKNPHKIVVFPSDHPSFNASGELLDRWGTPYFFHALSGTRLDILSPGPDKKRNTRDDIKLGLELSP